MEVCQYCLLPRSPDPLPDKYDPDTFCWRLRAPGSSIEAADMRKCLERTKARFDSAQRLLEETSDRFVATIQGLEAQVQQLREERETAEAYGVFMDSQLAEAQKELARWARHDCYPRDGNDL